MPERKVSGSDYERIEELIDFERLGGEIRGALSALPEDQRRAVTLHAVDGKSYRELADELGCTEPTARARVSRGLRRIAARLESGDAVEPIELERQRWKRRSTT